MMYFLYKPREDSVQVKHHFINFDDSRKLLLPPVGNGPKRFTLLKIYTASQGKTNNERCKCMVKYRIGATQNKTDNLRTLTAAWDPPPPSSDIKKLIIKLGLKIHIRTL